MTERDSEALRLISRFGFVLVEDLAFFLGCGVPRAYAVADRLMKSGELEQRKGIMRKTLYTVSRKYAREHGMTVSLRLSLSKYEHSTALVGLFLRLRKGEFFGFEYITERELLRDALSCEGGFSKRIGHLPDLTFVKDGKKTAIELELNRKTLGRMKKILDYYRGNLEISKVIYFTTKENFAYLKRLTDGEKLFEVRTL